MYVYTNTLAKRRASERKFHVNVWNFAFGISQQQQHQFSSHRYKMNIILLAAFYLDGRSEGEFY